MSRWTNLAEQRRRALRAAAKSVNSGSGLQIAKAESRRASCPVNTAETFLRGVGSLYPEPIKVSGKGKRWLREVLDLAIDRLTGRAANLRDAVDVL
jgi:hypothetical protein